MSHPKKKNTRIPAKKIIPGKKIILPEKKTKRSNLYFILFFFIWTLILYGNTVFNGYSIDDSNVTGPRNELVKKGFKAIPEILSTNYLNQKGNIGSQVSEYRPVVKITYAIEHALWGGGKEKQEARRSHIINLLLYFWIATALFFILRRLMKNFNILFPFLITVLFVAHPIHTEVVASLKNRDELLAFLCGIYALKFLLDYEEKKKVLYLVIAFVIFFIGYQCKSSILPFLFVYPLALYFFTEMKPKKFLIITGILAAAAALAFFLPRQFIPHGIRVNSYIENPLYFEKNFFIRTGTAMTTLLFYIRMLIVPYPFSFYYGYNTIPLTGWLNIWVILSFIIYASLLIWSVMKLKEKHILAFAILLYLGFIAMYSNLLAPAVGIVAERFMFAASLGFCIAMVFWIFRVFRVDPHSLTIEFNERAKIIVVVFIVLVAYTPLTITRNRDWRSLFSLYFADIGHLDNSVKANIEYAGFLMNSVYRDPNFRQTGLVNEYKQYQIISHFQKALELYPKDYQTLNDLGTVFLTFAKKPDSARIYLKKAIALNDTLKPAWVNLALSYLKTEKPDSALYCYRKILQMYPEELNAVFKIADIYAGKGQLDTAFRMNEEVMKKYPDMHIPYANIGYLYMMKGDTVNAVKWWEISFEKKRTFEVSVNLYNMYRIRGDMEKTNFYYNAAKEAESQQQEQVNQ